MQKTQSKKNYKIKRIGTSPYFKKDFLISENNFLNRKTGLIVLEASKSNDDYNNLPEIVITNTHNKIKEQHLDSFKNVVLIIHANSGYDNFDYNFVENFKGTIILGNEIRSMAVANYILSAIFQHYSPINYVDTWDKSRKWNRKLLNELNILIVGLGQIGSIVQNSLLNIVQTIDVYDPYKDLHLNANHTQYDLIILTCSYNQNNYHLINQAFLKKLSPSGLLINTSRGELINTNDLLEFLNKNQQAFAILDVFENEPFSENDFKNIGNLKKTSHIAGVYENIDIETQKFSAKIIADYLDDEIIFYEKYKSIILKNKIINKIII